MSCVLITALLFVGVALGDKRIIDLSYTHDTNSLFWPGSPPFKFTILSRGIVNDHWYESNAFFTAEHGGTHMDAPAHFYKGHWRIHEIPLERMMGPAVVIDVTSQAAASPDYRLSVIDLENWESVHGQIPRGAVVLMNSGWSSRYPVPELVFNTSDPVNVSTFHFPGFHSDAATWLVTHREVNMIGVDTPSVDFGQSTDFQAHITIARHNISILENVANLDQISNTPTTILAMPLKLYGSSGCPVRVVGLVDEDQMTSGRTEHRLNSFLVSFPTITLFYLDIRGV